MKKTIAVVISCLCSVTSAQAQWEPFVIGAIVGATLNRPHVTQFMPQYAPRSNFPSESYLYSWPVQVINTWPGYSLNVPPVQVYVNPPSCVYYQVRNSYGHVVTHQRCH